MASKESRKVAFVIPAWHKAYGEALIHASSPDAATFVARAEQQIVERSIELGGSIESDESRDLKSAVTVLLLIKNGAYSENRVPHSTLQTSSPPPIETVQERPKSE